MRGLVFAVVVLALAATPLVLAHKWLDQYRTAVDEPLNPLQPDAEVLEIPSGQSLRVLLGRLEVLGGPAVPPRIVLRAFLRWQPEWAQLKSGFYRINPGDSTRGVLEKVRRGEVATLDLTVVEGVRASDFVRIARQRTGIVDDLPSGIDDLARDLKIDPLEGAFLPETYRLRWGISLSKVLQQAHAAMTQARDAAWKRCQESGCALKSPQELLILASIIEKETGLGAERATISGVFHRRLARGMRLQTDPTVIYGLGDQFDGNLTRAHLRADTPWNTYTRQGLPPTPICLPGVASLEAAAQPEEGDALYFVSRGDGSHVFSATLQQHNRAVRKYQLGGR